MPSQDDQLPAPAPFLAMASRAAYSASPCSKDREGTNFILTQKLYCLCGCHLGSFSNLILFSQLWNILFFQFQNLLMLKKEREIQSAQLGFAKQIMQPA